MSKDLVRIENPEIISPLIPERPDDTSAKDALLSKMCLVVCGAAASALFVGGFMVSKLVYDDNDTPVYKSSQGTNEPARPVTTEPSKPVETTEAPPATPAGPQAFIKNGSYVVGTDVVAGRYRSEGVDTSLTAGFCYIVTKTDGTINENEVSYEPNEPVIIQVDSGSVVSVKGCLPFKKIG